MALSPSELTLRLPDWVRERVAAAGELAPGDERRMRLAIELARANVERGDGGPFAALVLPVGPGRPLAAAVNVVVPSRCSLAHAETLALALAQRAVDSHDLGAGPPLELVTTAQPCIQCFGAVWWSGIRRLVVGAGRAAVESIAGFREGPVPDDWVRLLRERPAPLAPVDVVTGVLAAEAADVLRAYRDGAGPNYGPG